MHLTFSLAGILLIGVIAADGAQGQSATMRCERRSPIVAAADTSYVRDGAPLSLDSTAMSCPDLARSSHIEPMAPSLLRVVSRIGVAVALAHASNTPEQWPQTPVGLFQRIGDQSGAVAIQTLTYHAVSQRLAWQPSNAVCPTGVLARTQCAIARTLVVRNTRGAPRPDVARLASMTLGSAGALLWRPERRSSGDAAQFILTRVGSGLAFATLRHAVARGRPTVPQ